MSDPIPMPEGVRKLESILCGCASLDNTRKPLIEELERLDRAEYQGEDDLAAAIVDYFGLSEHGVSIRGGWLTEDGKAALAFYRAHGLEWDRQPGKEYIDSEGCSYGEF